MMKITEVFTGLDILGKPIPLRIAGRESHKTLHGAVLTLLIVSLTSWSIHGAFQNYFDTRHPNVIAFQEESYTYPRINLGSDGISPILVITEGQNLIPPDQVKRYVNINVSAIKLNPRENPGTAQTTTLGEAIPCSQIRKETAETTHNYSEVQDQLFHTVFDSAALCLDPPQDAFFVEGKMSDFDRQVIRIEVRPCEGPDCFDISLLSPIEIVVVNPFYSLRPSEYHKPVQKIPRFGPAIVLSMTTKTIYDSQEPGLRQRRFAAG